MLTPRPPKRLHSPAAPTVFLVCLATLLQSLGFHGLAYAQATDTPTATPTSTPTNTPTITPTRTATFTSTPVLREDRFEPNNSSAQATWVSVQATTADLTMYPSGDVDWYRFVSKAGNRYEIETSVDIGLDTFMELFIDPGAAPVATNDDKAVGNLGSKIGYTSNFDGSFYLRITNVDPTDPASKEYSLTILEVAPGAIIPGSADSFEPNYDFGHATLIASGESIAANFVPWPGGDLNAPDNDYYRIYVKAGVTVTCETSNLGPSADTNMILYDPAGNLLGGNDDIALGNYASRVSVRLGSTGDVFVLVGQAHPVPLTDTPNLTYNLICNTTIPAPPPTATPSAFVPSTPVPPTPVAPPTPTPTSTPTFFNIVALATPIRPTPSLPAVASFDVQVFYDANNNEAADDGEGIGGLTVEVFDRSLGLLLARGVTDDDGRVRLTASAFGDFELRIPFLGLRRPLTAADRSVDVWIRAGILPLTIP